MGNWIKAALGIVRRLPVARYLRPLWTAALKEVVEVCGDDLQRMANAEIDKGVDGIMSRVNPLIDKAQLRLLGMVDALPLPAHVEARIKTILVGAVDQLQARLCDSAGCGKSAGAVHDAFNTAFDQFQASLKARIDAL